MLCERCGVREANIQYTQVVNGKHSEHHFCVQCAKEMDFGPCSAIFDDDSPFKNFLTGLLGLGNDKKEDDVPSVTCPTCGTSYAEFIKKSAFGCPDCYSVFDLLMQDKIRQLQGSDTHKGRRPKILPAGRSGLTENVTKEKDVADTIKELRDRLKAAVRAEDYEMAAACRDRIKELGGDTK